MKTILAIDDIKNNLITIKAVITANMSDCKVLTALSGEEGIKIAQKEQPDTILLDIIMPVMDGFQTCKKLKKDELTKHIPVIMITAIKTDPASRVKGLKLGADAFLSKPIDAIELSAQVSVMLRIKEAEDKLRKEKDELDKLVAAKTKETKYQATILENVSDPIISIDMDYNIVSWNEAAELLYGWNEEEVRGKTFNDVLLAEYPHGSREDTIKTLNEAGYYKGEVIHYKKDGSRLIISSSVSFIKDSDGNCIGIVSVNHDVTERKKAAEEINRFAQLVSSSTDMMAFLNSSFIYIAANKAYISAFNLTSEQLIGKTVTDLVGKKFFINVIRPHAKICLAGESVNFQDWFDFPNYGKQYMDVTYSPYYNKDNEITGFIVNARDITERMVAEEQFNRSEHLRNKLLDNIPVISLIQKKHTREIVACNKLAIEYGAVIGKKCYETIHKCEHICPFCLAPGLWKTNEPQFIESEYVGRYWEIRWIPFTDELYIHFFTDITERKQANLALHESEHLLRKSQEAAQIGSYVLDIVNNSWIGSEYLDTIFGIKKDYNRTIAGWTELIHADDKEMMASYFKENVLKNHKPFNKKYRIVKQNSKAVIWVHGLGEIEFNDNGDFIKMIGVIQDISDRIESEEKLKKSEERFRLVTENSRELIWEVDVSGMYTYVSPVLENLLGYKPEEIVGKKYFYEFFHPEDKEELKNTALATFKQKQPFTEFINRNISKSGKTVWFSTSGVPILDDQKNLLGYRGADTDITEQRKAQEALQNSEQKYKDLFEKSDDAVLIISDNLFIDCNLATVKMLRYKNKKELLGTHPSELSPEKQPDGRLSFEKAEEMMKIALKKGSQRFAWDHKKSDGEVFPVEVLLTSIIGSDGKNIIHTVLRDITDRKRSDQTQKLLYNISNAVITTDNLEELIKLIRKELGVIIDTSNFYVALYNSKTDTISLPFMADEKDKFLSFPAGKTLTYYVIKTKKSLLATKERLKKLQKSGEVEIFGTDSEIWLGVPLKIEGQVTGIIAVQSYTDENAFTKSDMEILEFIADQISISIDRKKAEQDLKTALYQATESDRLKSTFLATISHELRTPLNAIIGFSSLVNKETPIDNILQYNSTIHSSGIHLLNIVEDIFDITLIEAGESKLKKASVILNDIMNDIHEIVKAEQHNINKGKLDLNLIIDEMYRELTIKTDPVKLKQILINLLKNALKFTHEGFVHFGYKINEYEGKKYVEFFVKDTGIGIPIEKQKFIFDIFTRLEDSHTATYGGTGIGLSIAKKLTEMLGGKIWLVSDPKSDSLFRGSTFYFTLPYDEGESENEIKIEETMLRKTTDSKGETFLVVEDDQHSFEFLQIILQKQGARIFRAIDGEEAIKFCKENPDIDLVLMDINMPIMNGYEATKEIKKFRPKLPIIAQTAYAIAGDKEKALAAGCDDYISKPIKKEELIEKIRKLLSR